MATKLYTRSERRSAALSDEAFEKRKKRGRAYVSKLRVEREKHNTFEVTYENTYEPYDDKSELFSERNGETSQDASHIYANTGHETRKFNTRKFDTPKYGFAEYRNLRFNSEKYDKNIKRCIDYVKEFQRFHKVKADSNVSAISFYAEKLRDYKYPETHHSDKLRHGKADTSENPSEIRQSRKHHEQSKRRIKESIVQRAGEISPVLDVSNAVMRRVNYEREDEDASEEALHDGGDAIKHYADKMTSGRGRAKYSSKLHKKGSKGKAQTLENSKKKIKKKRMQMRSRQEVKTAEKVVQEIGKIAEKIVKTIIESVKAVSAFVESNPMVAVIILVVLLVFLAVTGVFSSCSMIGALGQAAAVGSSYTASDEDILGADEDYSAMEDGLRDRIENIKSEFPGYDEYKLECDEIGHDPYKLAAILTVIYEDYKREEVQEELKKIFDLQYKFSTKKKTEKRKKKVVKDGKEVTVEYDYKILTVTLKNRTLDYVVDHLGLTADQLERYAILVSTYGNRKYLFDGSLPHPPGDDDEDDDDDGIPPDYLTDEQFARMLKEAKKYLGMPYVWGGSSPEEGFDCSGYVCWVINHCGNGWNVGRQTADGLKKCTSRVKESAVKPGDLVFFKGTYKTKGASHVGIVVDPVRKRMAHCGDPIQIASYDTPYWRAHAYCYGRIH